jgi:cation diffusion facilitator CzcD-associated flavoprotein CzcO
VKLGGEVRVAVIGAGFGGIGAAIRMQAEGIQDFVILERGSGLGGTWRANTYPGCACDVPSHLYSYSFAMNPEWTRDYATQPEILSYLERTARDYDVAERIVYDCEVLGAEWDADARRWRLDTVQGPLVAQSLVVATGPLSEPSIPDIPGLASFGGTLFHSAHWDHEHSLEGERVAVIGTGASAVQFIPHVAQQAAHLDVYQRTPGWIVPRPDNDIPPERRALFKRRPVLQRAMRYVIYYGAEILNVGLIVERRLLTLLEAVARRKLRKEVPDPELRAKLTPSYRIGCERIIFSNDYLPTLSRPDVELVTDGIAEIEATGIRAADGTRRPVDTIILGTGFKLWDSPFSKRVVGVDGAVLGERWHTEGPQAYRGTMFAGFPNLFFIIGPNTALGNNSMINIIEGQLVYLIDALKGMETAGADAIDVHRPVQDRHNARLQAAMDGTVWVEGGCNSWYLSPDGSNRTLWPSFSNAFLRQMRGFDIADFEVSVK